MTTATISFWSCYRVDGIFTHLKELNLNNSSVRVDIWDIGENDFSKLEQLDILITLYGGGGVELQLISDGPDLTKTPHLFKNAASNTTERWAWEVIGRVSWWVESLDRHERRHCRIRSSIRSRISPTERIQMMSRLLKLRTGPYMISTSYPTLENCSYWYCGLHLWMEDILFSSTFLSFQSWRSMIATI